MWQPARLTSSHMLQLIIACNAERRRAAIRNSSSRGSGVSFKKQEGGRLAKKLVKGMSEKHRKYQQYILNDANDV